MATPQQETIENRMIACIFVGEPFTADDVTKDGSIAVDPSRAQSGRQSSIGALFMEHSRAGHIEPTGEVIRSRAPSRKGGAIRVWRATPAGIAWAETA